MSYPHTLEKQPLGLHDKTHRIRWRCRWHTDSWGQMTSYDIESCLMWWTLISVAKPLFLSSWTRRDDISHLPSHLGVTPWQSSRQWEVRRNDTSHLCLDHRNRLHGVACSRPLASTYMLRPIKGTCGQRTSEPQDGSPQSPRKATSGSPHRTAMWARSKLVFCWVAEILKVLGYSDQWSVSLCLFRPIFTFVVG